MAKKTWLSQAYELGMEFYSNMLFSLRLTKIRKKLDERDDKRRENMITRENNFFEEAFRILKSTKYSEEVKVIKMLALLIKFHTFKMKDRELMLKLEEADDKIMSLQFERHYMGIESYSNEIEKLDMISAEKDLEL